MFINIFPTIKLIGTNARMKLKTFFLLKINFEFKYIFKSYYGNYYYNEIIFKLTEIRTNIVRL